MKNIQDLLAEDLKYIKLDIYFFVECFYGRKFLLSKKQGRHTVLESELSVKIEGVKSIMIDFVLDTFPEVFVSVTTKKEGSK